MLEDHGKHINDLRQSCDVHESDKLSHLKRV